MTIYGKGCISNYRNCSLSYVWYSVLYRMLTLITQTATANKPYNKNLRISAIQFRKLEATFTESCNKIPGYITNKKLF